MRITSYDITGRVVRELLRTQQTAGMQEVSWDGHDDLGQPLGSGVYVYRLIAGRTQLTRKLVMLR